MSWKDGIVEQALSLSESRLRGNNEVGKVQGRESVAGDRLLASS